LRPYLCPCSWSPACGSTCEFSGLLASKPIQKHPSIPTFAVVRLPKVRVPDINGRHASFPNKPLSCFINSSTFSACTGRRSSWLFLIVARQCISTVLTCRVPTGINFYPVRQCLRRRPFFENEKPFQISKSMSVFGGNEKETKTGSGTRYRRSPVFHVTAPMPCN